MHLTRYVNKQLADIAQEEALLKSDCHPEQVQPLAIVVKYVGDKLGPYQKHREYALQNADNNLEAETAVINAQYVQKVENLREKNLEKLYDQVHVVRKADAKEKSEEKEDAEGNKEEGTHRAFYKTDDRGMFMKE